MHTPKELSYSKCRQLLADGIVGRVAFCTPSGPAIIPVNYAVVGEAVVFRTAPYTLLGRQASTSRLAFEVDHLDYERHQAWSVVATGPGRLVEDEAELHRITGLREPRPWADGTRPMHIRLQWDELTGRQLGTGWTYSNEMPVRRWADPTET